MLRQWLRDVETIFFALYCKIPEKFQLYLQFILELSSKRIMKFGLHVLK